MNLRDALSRLAPIGLEQLGAAALMDRVDRKYVLPVDELDDVLAEVSGRYRVLDVGGVRLSRYATQYFDTEDLRLYDDHHANRLPRAKVRVREYVDSGTRFVEVKRRTNTGRTTKSRVEMSRSTEADVDAALARGLSEVNGCSDPSLVLHVAYERATLVHKKLAERVTIDVDLEFAHEGRVVKYPGLVFVEVKQPVIAPSAFVDALRARNVRQGSLSKYCLGVARLVERAKSNRFKPALSRLERVTA